MGRGFTFRWEDDTSGVWLKVDVVRMIKGSISEKINFEHIKPLARPNKGSEKEMIEYLKKRKELLDNHRFGIMV